MKKGNHFIEHSIPGVLSFFKDSLFAEEIAVKNAFLQRRDARIKTLSVLFLLLTVLFAKNLCFLAGIYLFVLAFAAVSGIPLGFFLKRTWIFIPLFSLFIAVPALFNPFSPGVPLFIFKVFHLKLVMTKQGVLSAGAFVMRVATSVSIAVLFALTTKHHELLKVLRVLRIPRIFVMTLGMCYRYLYLFTEVVENTYLAIKSRVGGRIHHEKGRAIVAWSVAALWQRSYHLNHQVYQAMLSRGYRGEPKIDAEFKTDAADWVTFLCILAFFILTLIYRK